MQVQIIPSQQTTSSGGVKYNIVFLGRNNFDGRSDTLVYTAPVDNTNRQTRDEITNVIAMGLMPFLVRNNQQKYIMFDYCNKNKLIMQSIDKYKNWVYAIQKNTNLTSNATATLFAGTGSVSAAHITDLWKVKIIASTAISSSQYETATYAFNGNTLITNLSGLIVKSINDHWSYGLEPAYYSSTYSNVKSQFSFAPGVEFNIFPYTESVNHLFTVKLRAQPLYNIYIDSTVFNKTKEPFLNSRLDATYTRIEKWGNVSVKLTASDYLNRTKAYRFDGLASLNVRISKGLFINLLGNASIINNQISLSRKKLTPEQIVLNQNEQATNYTFGIQFGFTYTFGSIFNNIVNPRFESGINIDPEVVNSESQTN